MLLLFGETVIPVTLQNLCAAWAGMPLLFDEIVVLVALQSGAHSMGWYASTIR